MYQKILNTQNSPNEYGWTLLPTSWYFPATSSVIIALVAAGTAQLSFNSRFTWVTAVLPHLRSCRSPTMLQTRPHNNKQWRIQATNQSSSTSTKAQQNTSAAQPQHYEEMNPNYFKWASKVWSMTMYYPKFIWHWNKEAGIQKVLGKYKVSKEKKNSKESTTACDKTKAMVDGNSRQ